MVTVTSCSCEGDISGTIRGNFITSGSNDQQKGFSQQTENIHMLLQNLCTVLVCYDFTRGVDRFMSFLFEAGECCFVSYSCVGEGCECVLTRPAGCKSVDDSPLCVCVLGVMVSEHFYEYRNRVPGIGDRTGPDISDST